ncbi:Cyclomaltodextrinase [Microbulbifer aggregans]|uniref:Cyclomaltodextrinase n=1 Tax=Microbulbifer aggregans TaxID=1769779 RepID=A0A1C9W407_9GAMM|nr:glycoside hydrolase family 13 protein [Microbulbifer aggregans]AOS95870.1 Cyclomaltodextrinase [Microbulbifer aggregans]
MRQLYLVALVLISLSGTVTASEPERVEPPFWWTGMAEQSLQLLVYGRDISRLEPETNSADVTVLGTETVENPNYLFINLNIAADTDPGTFNIALKEKGKARFNFEYTLRSRTPGSASRRGFDSRDAIYLITPDRFANGNPGNDNSDDTLEGPNRQHPGGRHGGDIAGMQQHLDYIAEMGFTAIWPNPLVENDQPGYSYHGYSATDHYRIDPRFGSNEEFRQFVASADARGLGIIQDVVLNHIGSGHWWMKDLPDSDWLNGKGINKGEFEITNHSRFTPVDPYASEVDKRGFLDGWFVDSMPDMNQRHPLVANYLIQNTLWWIEYAGLSGIRADTYAYSDPDFLQQWASRIHREYPNFSIVGEEWTRSPALVSHWQRKEDEAVSGGRLKSMMDFPLHYALREGLADSESWNSGLITMYEGLAHDFEYPNPNRLVIFAGNHDTSRLYSQLDGDLNLYRMAIAYIATMRGIPQFFYGDELLFESPKQRDDGIVRSDFPGGWQGDKANGFTGAGLSEEQLEAQSFTRKLFNWRKRNPVVHNGKLMHYAPLNDTYVYFRYNDDKTVMVAINKGSEPFAVPTGHFSEVMNGKKSATDVISGKQHDIDTLSIPAREVMVLELE